MISKILIEGVRTHEHTEIALSRLTCLVGPNGSGKSTILQAIGAGPNSGKLPSWIRAGQKSWNLVLENREGQRKIFSRGILQRKEPGIDLGVRPIHFRFDSNVLRGASEFKEARPKLGADGSQLAAVLAGWKLSDQERFGTTLRQLKQIVPTLDDLRPSTTKLGDLPAFELLFDFHLAPSVPSEAVSEGTLLALGLLAALHGAEKSEKANISTVVLLDDIDRGLHPDAQIELIKLLRQLAELKDLQIVMTTHSPYIVDALSPEEVCVLALDSTGTTRARQLSEIPGAERYRGMLSTGELWSSHGESWVLEEQAKSNAS